MKKYDYLEYFRTVMSICIKEKDMLSYAIGNINKINKKAYYEDMHQYEKQADNLRRDMIKNLLKDFIPMFEREDIMELSKIMEEVIDAIEKIFKLITIYNINEFDNAIYMLLDSLDKEVEAIKLVIDELENFKNRENINDLVHSAMNIESDADLIYMNALTELFEKAEGNIFDALPKKELIQSFEDAINICEKVAYFIEVVQINNL